MQTEKITGKNAGDFLFTGVWSERNIRVMDSGYFFRLLYTTFPGAVNGERFKEHLREMLVDFLRPGDIVIMDNLRSHKVDGVVELIESVGAKVLYLPPYSNCRKDVENAHFIKGDENDP